MSVRVRLRDDLPSCVRALRAVHEADGYPACWPQDPAAWLTPPGCLAAWVADVKGTPVAHVCLVRGAHPADAEPAAATTSTDPAHLATVSRLFTAPAARGRGLATALLEVVIDHAEASGLQLVLDVVEDGGPAVDLYERTGWRLLHERLADWTTPDGTRLPVRVYTTPPIPTRGS